MNYVVLCGLKEFCGVAGDNLLCNSTSLLSPHRISTEHSPKLQIRSHSYLRAVSEVSINRSLDTLDPKTLLDPKSLLSSPQYRSRNESYMRAMSTISQVGRQNGHLFNHVCFFFCCFFYICSGSQHRWYLCEAECLHSTS